jgi:hypothetical protein
MTYIQQEQPVEHAVVPSMETSQDYRQLAAECERLAEEAMTEDQRAILRKMAVAWRKVAAEYDKEHSLNFR